MSGMIVEIWQVKNKEKEFQEEAFLLPHAKPRHGLGFTHRIRVILEILKAIMKSVLR